MNKEIRVELSGTTFTRKPSEIFPCQSIGRQKVTHIEPWLNVEPPVGELQGTRKLGIFTTRKVVASSAGHAKAEAIRKKFRPRGFTDTQAGAVQDHDILNLCKIGRCQRRISMPESLKPLRWIDLACRVDQTAKRAHVRVLRHYTTYDFHPIL